MPALRVWLYDNSIGKYLSNAPVPVVNMFGSSLYPALLAQPLLLGANASLSVTVINDYNTLDIGYLQLAFLGRKVCEN
jgi:hypothetical protein